MKAIQAVDRILSLIADNLEDIVLKQASPGVNRPLANQYRGSQHTLNELYAAVKQIRDQVDSEKVSQKDIQEAIDFGWTSSGSDSTFVIPESSGTGDTVRVAIKDKEEKVKDK